MAKTGYSWLPLNVVRAAMPYAEDRGVSEIARSKDGFVAAYIRARGLPHAMGLSPKDGEAWTAKRQNFLDRQLGLIEAYAEDMNEDESHRIWEPDPGRPRGERPTRHHLSLVMWAYSPEPEKLRKWLVKAQHRAADVEAAAGGRMPNPASGSAASMDEDDILSTLRELRATAAAWEPDAKIVGNIPAGDIVALCDALSDPLVAAGGGAHGAAAMVREPGWGLKALLTACEEYTEREEGCALYHVRLNGPAVELGEGAYIAMVRLKGGGTQPILGYNLPDLGEAYYHPLDPGTKVYVLQGAVVLAHPDIRLSDRGLWEDPKADRSENPILDVGPWCAHGGDASGIDSDDDDLGSEDDDPGSEDDDGQEDDSGDDPIEDDAEGIDPEGIDPEGDDPEGAYSITVSRQGSSGEYEVLDRAEFDTEDEVYDYYAENMTTYFGTSDAALMRMAKAENRLREAGVVYVDRLKIEVRTPDNDRPVAAED